ncbi:hypothetical protein MKX08_001577 [Trichoderma sp. CBMAI-0020]|nr:hypothetical protein MKX08_001577 [Trichoderma sp. CBMAI-0020]
MASTNIRSDNDLPPLRVDVGRVRRGSQDKGPYGGPYGGPYSFIYKKMGDGFQQRMKDLARFISGTCTDVTKDIAKDHNQAVGRMEGFLKEVQDDIFTLSAKLNQANEVNGAIDNTNNRITLNLETFLEIHRIIDELKNEFLFR